MLILRLLNLIILLDEDEANYIQLLDHKVQKYPFKCQWIIPFNNC